MAMLFNGMLLILSTALLAVAGISTALAAGLQGDCTDCHTMHNSLQGTPVAKVGVAGTVSAPPNANLLKIGLYRLSRPE